LVIYLNCTSYISRQLGYTHIFCPNDASTKNAFPYIFIKNNRFTWRYIKDVPSFFFCLLQKCVSVAYDKLLCHGLCTIRERYCIHSMYMAYMCILLCILHVYVRVCYYPVCVYVYLKISEIFDTFEHNLITEIFKSRKPEFVMKHSVV